MSNAAFLSQAAPGTLDTIRRSACFTGARRPTVFIAHPSDLLTDHVPNGDGLVAYGFIRELAARDYRLHIAVRGVALREPLPPNVVLHPIPPRCPSPVRDRLQAMYSIRRLLARLLRQERIDVVHQMNPVFAGLSLGLIGCGLPLVLGTFVARWPDGEVWEEGQGRLTRGINAATRWVVGAAQQSQAAALLIATPAALNRIALPGLIRGRLFEIQHGIDTTLFAPAPGPPPPRPSILFYNHLDRRKGVFVLLEAFEIVARALQDCRLTLVGGGEHIPEVKSRIAASPHAERIAVLGPVQRASAPALFASHTVYCLPSFGEPYGMTVLEAMACGRPVVASRAGGPAHLVPPEGGRLVPAGDAAALAAALQEILGDPALQQAMGAANRARVAQQHDWRHVVDHLEAVYASVLHPR
jgi:glycosyltransferase involved in cell wall biosynthesis